MASSYTNPRGGAQRKQSGNRAASGARPAGKKMEGPKLSELTTHYMYAAFKNEETDSWEKEYTNGVYILEQESEYGTQLKLIVKGKDGVTLPEGNYYIGEKRKD